MHRILSSKRFQRIVAGIILPVFLFIGVLGQPMSALAQTVHSAQRTMGTESTVIRTGSVVQLAQGSPAAPAAAKAGKANPLIAAGIAALGSLAGGIAADLAGLYIFYVIFDMLVNVFSKIVNELLIWSLRTFILLTGYNDFLNNEFVNSGWATLRDIANLFFVVILLIIAFATVLNISSYEYQQLLPKFVLAIFLVNFSRTIVGLMIDASQVVMVTFASAFYQSAAGNFVRLLRIDQWLQVKSLVSNAVTSAGAATDSSVLSTVATVASVDVVSNFVALLFTLAVSTFALGVGLTLVAVIVYRIVALWLLIIFSPLAFLAWVLPSTRSYFSQWMGQLVKQLTVGPLLVFVVWLALSTVQQNPQSYALLENSQSITQIMSSLGMTSGYSELENGTLGPALAQGVGDNQIASTAISSWNNLTAFVVAITVLIGGIKFAGSMSGGAGAFAQKLTGFARKPFDFAEGKAKSFGKWAAKKGISEPINESAWYLRNKGDAKKAPVIGRFFKSSDERIKESEKFNRAYKADKFGIRNFGEGRKNMNRLEADEMTALKELAFQNSDEMLEYGKTELADKSGQGAVIRADGNEMSFATKILPGKGMSKQYEDAAKVRALREMYMDKKKTEIERDPTQIDKYTNSDGKVVENTLGTRQNRDAALKGAMEEFDKALKIAEHNPKPVGAEPARLDPGDKNIPVADRKFIAGHIVSTSNTPPTTPGVGAARGPGVGGGAPAAGGPPATPAPGTAGAPIPSAPAATPGVGAARGPGVPGGASPYAGGPTGGSGGSGLAASGKRDQAAPDVNVAQNSQSSTTVNVNMSAPQGGTTPVPPPATARRPVGFKPKPLASAGVSLSEAKAASDAKNRAAQDEKAATRAASARSRKEDAKTSSNAPAGIPSASNAAPTLRRDAGATGDKAAQAAREKTEAQANAGGPNIVVEAAQNAELSREVENRLRSLEASESAQGSIAENRQRQIDELGKQLSDMADGKPKVIRQLIQNNPDVRKIVADIVKNPLAARQLQQKIERELKKNPSFKGLSAEDASEISREQTKVALRALKKEEPSALETNSRRPDPVTRSLAREVLDEPDDVAETAQAPSSPVSQPPEDTTNNA
ncbi:MAG: hypothetical protein AAB384_04520 [Patescibacteria group bacterium]